MKIKKIKYNFIINFSAIIILSLIAGFAVKFTFAAFNQNINPAPAGNAPGFLDTSVNDQSKSGKLWLGGNSSSDSGFTLQVLGNGTLRTTGTTYFNTGTTPATNGLLVPYGNVGIGTTMPQEKLVLEGGNFLQTGKKDPAFLYDSGNEKANGLYVSGKYAYVVYGVVGPGMRIFDISNPHSPSLVNFFSSPSLSGASDIYVSGKYAYATSNTNGLVVIDISNPYSPIILGSVLADARAVYISGKYAYVADDDTGLKIFDISNPSLPVLIGNDSVVNSGTDVFVSGNYAYLSSRFADANKGLQIFDISNPSQPVFLNSGLTFSPVFSFPKTVYVSGKYAYLGEDSSYCLKIIDISNPSLPSLKKDLCFSDAPQSGPNKIYVSEKYAYVGMITGDDYLIDISSPTNPVIIGRYSNGTTSGVFISGKYIYLTDSSFGGLIILNISGIDSPAANIGNLSTSQINISENAQVGNNLYVRTGLNVGGGIMSDGDAAGSDIYATSVIKLMPNDSPPDCAGFSYNKGKIYYDKSMKELCYCNGSVWSQMDGAGGC